MERSEPPDPSLQLDGSHDPARRHRNHLRWQRNL